MKQNATDRRQFVALRSGLLLMLGTFALHGCGQAEEEAGMPAGGNTSLVVLSAGISEEIPAGTRAAMTANTRAVTATELTTGSLALFLRGATGTGYADKNNLKYTYSAGGTPSKWLPTDVANTLYLGAKQASVCAYYPHNGDGTCNDPTAIPLTSQAYTATAANLSYGTDRTMDGTGTGCKTSFTLKRAYAKVNFTFTRDNYPSTGKLTQITLANCCTKNSTLNIKTGVYAAATAVADLSNTVSITIPANKTAVSTADGDASKNSFLVVPGSIPDYAGAADKGAEVVLTVDGKQVRVLIPKTTLAAWQAGKAYDIHIKLTGTGITLGTVETKDWTTAEVKDDAGKPFVPKLP
ncbi:fimbrillin family protein [Bacteroides ovatus]|uniref:fimbrillin family protein n=1 Tax=Bacteroides ovatus TaxID=28116 RepID=UPI001B8BBF5A|nr:fimbrillin family protein [Bacteroides ovatus]MCE8873773.1 fimbrillin family protein [Bacteroides ovatus]QUT82597.1 Fimbrillin-like protein [Bacteroides ovatus]